MKKKVIVSLAFLLLGMMPLSEMMAQDFSVRILKEFADIDFLYATVDIKSGGSTFKLGSSTFYFDYNMAVLGPPEIVQNLNYTGLVTDPSLCGGFCVYAPSHSLANSPGRTGISVSLGFPGAGAILPSTYTGLIRLRFPILDTLGDVSIVWRGTGMPVAPTRVRKDDEISPVPANQMVGLSGPVTPLPVEILEFSAEAAKKEVRLEWKTAFELNNAGISLQRKDEGGQFKDISYFPGAGDSYTIKSYSFVDQDVMSGNLYTYRLKQTDLNGSISFSNMIELRLAPFRLVQVNNPYPNPSDGYFSLEIFLETGTKLSLRIVSPDGRQLFEEQRSLQNGLNNWDLDLTAFASGMYFLLLDTDESRIEKTLIRR
jgi:hypothetical protein